MGRCSSSSWIPPDRRIHGLAAVVHPQRVHARAAEERELVRALLGDVALPVPDTPQQFIAVDVIVADQLAQTCPQRLAQVLISIQGDDPFAPRLLEGEYRGCLSMTAQWTNEYPAAIAGGDLEGRVLALAIVDQHDLVHDSREARQAALDHRLLVADHQRRGNRAARRERALVGFHDATG